MKLSALDSARWLSRTSPRRVAWAVFGVLFGSATIMLVYLDLKAMRHLRTSLRDHVAQMVQAAGEIIDVDLHESLRDPGQFGSPDYQRALAPLVKFHREVPDVTLLYTLRLLPDGAQAIVLDTANDAGIRAQQHARGHDVTPSPLLQAYTPPAVSTQADEAMRRGWTFVFPKPYEDERGTFITAHQPMFNADGELVGWTVLNWDRREFSQRINEVWMAGGLALLVSLLISIVLARVAGGVAQTDFATLDAIRTAQAQLRQETANAEAANRAKSELLAVATHDLKNPLSAIAGMSEILLEMKRASPAPDEATRRDIGLLERINQTAQHMFELVRAILANEGLEHGQNLETSVFNLAEVCTAVVDFNRPAAERKQITIHSDIAPRVMVEGDAARLREACDNYVTNAVKYSPAGASITLRLSINRTTQTTTVAVSDRGPGISAADQERLFTKFQKLSAKPTGGELSTGLGLSIVKTVVERHGGKVGCNSELGQGATFWMKIPLAPDAGKTADPSLLTPATG